MTITLHVAPTLTPELLEQASCADELHITFSNDALLAVEASHTALQRVIAAKKPVYGITTGFGPLVQFQTTNNDAQGLGLIQHLGAGFGAPLEAYIVRATMLLRLHTLAQGHSGISREALFHYAHYATERVMPDVPSIGSLGASGDLIPLAHIARAMTQRADQTFTLTGRDALALVNGTSCSTALAALALVRAERMIAQLEDITGWIMRLLQCRKNSLHPRLHAAKGHQGQIIAARNIAQEVDNFADKYSVAEDTSRPLQEVYSIRCAPQILGAVRDVMRSARELIQQEMNGIDDNPLILNDNEEMSADALHGGNFMTQHTAFAADMLNNALTQIGNLAERHIYLLTNPETSGAPLLLAFQPGTTSGMAGVQLTATALVAEMRSRAQCYASSTLPTNAGNQDIVPMGFQAAREVFGQTERLAGILACEILCCTQLAFLIQEGLAKGADTPPPDAIAALLQDFTPLREDRAMYNEISRLATRLLHNGNNR
jgi:histidine ammonia-lyase/tyrosine ammonia-lyase